MPSPAAGVIEEIFVEDGNRVEPGMDLFKLKLGGEVQLNRCKSMAPPATQPSLILKDLQRLSCRWSPTFTTDAFLVEPDFNDLKYQ